MEKKQLIGWPKSNNEWIIKLKKRNSKVKHKEALIKFNKNTWLYKIKELIRIFFNRKWL